MDPTLPQTPPPTQPVSPVYSSPTVDSMPHPKWVLILIVILVVTLILGGGFFAYQYYNESTKKAAVVLPSFSPSPSASPDQLSQAEINQRIDELFIPIPALSEVPEEKILTKQIANEKNQLIELENIKFHSPWQGTATVTKQGVGTSYKFSNANTASIFMAKPELTMTEKDLKLGVNEFSEKYKMTATTDLNLQILALKITPEIVKQSSNVDEANRNFKLLLIKRTTLGIDEATNFIVKRDNLTVIENILSSTVLISLEDEQKNHYTIILSKGKLTEKQIDTIIASIEVN